MTTIEAVLDVSWKVSVPPTAEMSSTGWRGVVVVVALVVELEGTEVEDADVGSEPVRLGVGVLVRPALLPSR